MNLVDSSGWLEYFSSGPNSGYFASILKETDSLVVPTICMYEVFKGLLVQLGEEEALQANGIMSLGVIADLTREVAVNAAFISSEFKLGMADSIILATARANNATLWTQDEDFQGIGGVQYIKKN